MALRRARCVQAVKVKRGRLPPYLPELSLAERVFQELRLEVEGHMYRIIEEKMEAVERALEALLVQRERLIQLTAYPYIRQAFRDLGSQFANYDVYFGIIEQFLKRKIIILKNSYSFHQHSNEPYNCVFVRLPG